MDHTAYGDNVRDDHNGAMHHDGVGHDEGEHHGDKKSVIKKVKDKAKKIKDTIKSHVGHGHDHDHDEDDDEMDYNPDVHGQHIGAKHIGERSAVVGGSDTNAPAGGGPGGYQAFNPKTTHYFPGQEETFGGSRTDAGPVLGSAENRGHVVSHTHTPGTGHSSGTEIGETTSPAAGGSPGAYQAFTPKMSAFVPGQKETLGGSRTDTGLMLGSAENRGHAVSHTHTPGIGHSSGTEDIGVVHKPKLGGIVGRDSDVLRHLGDGDHGDRLGGASDIPVSKPEEYQTFDTTSSKYIPGQEETLGWSRTDTGRSKFSEEQSCAPGNTPIVTQPGVDRSGVLGTKDAGVLGKVGGILDRPTHLEKDPHSPRDVGEQREVENYQTKVTDPTGRGGEEVGITKILHQLGKIDINDESTQKPDSMVKTGQQEELFTPNLDQHQKTSTGSHNQFSPEPITEPEYDATIPISWGLDTEVKHKPESYTEALSPILDQHQKTTTGNRTEPEYDATIPEHKPESYTGKISSLASELASKAKLATDSVASKIGYGGAHETPTHIDSTVQGPLDDKPVPGGYGETISSMSTSIANTAVNAKDSVASKLGYGGTQDVGSTGSGPDKGISVKELAHETPSHIDSTVQGPLDDKPVPGGYGETISSISTSITNTAVNAKDAVASKLGYGETHDVGSTDAVPDKGVSVKEYLAEKLKPAEEDKALSKVITDALPLYKQKENPIENPIDVGHEESESGEKKKVVIKGRVTESEEVADRLGRAEETSFDGAGPGLASPGKSVMDRIRDAAGSWFSTTDEPHLEAGDHTPANGRSHASGVAGMQQQQGLGETQVQ